MAVAPPLLLVGPVVFGGCGRVDRRMVYGPVGGIFFARWGAIGKAHYNNDELVVLGRRSFCLCGEEKPKIVIREDWLWRVGGQRG